MTNPTRVSTTDAAFPAITTNSCSQILRWCNLIQPMGTFVLALMLASCTSNSNNTGGSASGGATRSGGASAGTAGSQTATGAGGSNSVPGTGGASGGATSTGGGSGGTSLSASGGSGAGGATGSDAGNGGIEGTGGSGGATVGMGGHGSGGSSASGGHTNGVDAASGGGATGDAGGGSFALASPDLVDGAHFHAKFTCASTVGTVGQLGNGVNPELDWSGVPAGTASFAITFIDTTLGDTSPMGQHWAIWNIPATLTKFPQATATLTGDLATAKQSGKFLTPCAQSLVNNADDQYEFTVYALSTATLNITGTTVANALTALKALTPLGTAKLHGHAGLKGK